MKNRLIVAAIGIPALLAVIFFTPIWGWGIVVAIMAAFCAWELLHTAMPKFVPRFAVYAGVCGAAIVLGAAFGKSELVFKIAAYVLFVTMFVEMMISFHKSERIPFQDLALVFTAGIIIPWMLSSLVRLGLNDPKAPYLLLPFVITWLSDSGAFFVGRSLGKTKLAPALSRIRRSRAASAALCARSRRPCSTASYCTCAATACRSVCSPSTVSSAALPDRRATWRFPPSSASTA